MGNSFVQHPVGRQIAATLFTLAAVSCAEPGPRTVIGEPRDTPLEPPCSNCTLGLRPVAILGDTTARASVAGDAAFHSCSVALVDDSTFASARLVGGGEISLFTVSGSRLGEVARRGQGPGEFGGDLRILPLRSGGSVVVDRSLQRATVFGSDWEVKGVVALPIRPDAQLVLSSGQLLVHARPHPRIEDAVHRFLRVDLATGAVAPLGEPVPVAPDPELRELDQWVVGGGFGGRFVAARIWEYVVVEFDHDGDELGRFVRDADWIPFPEIDLGFLDGIHVDRPPPPIISSLQVDSDGLMRVYALVPNPDWQPLGPIRLSPRWAAETFDTRIEILDLVRGQVLASGRFDEVLAPVCGSDWSYTIRETEDGDTRIAVFRVESGAA